VLRQHIARVAESRRGHVVLVLGEAGVGKSRLAAEATSEAGNRGLTVISVRCPGVHEELSGILVRLATGKPGVDGLAFVAGRERAK
jgi:DNA-binding NtrC family response regulator